MSWRPSFTATQKSLTPDQVVDHGKGRAAGIEGGRSSFNVPLIKKASPPVRVAAAAGYSTQKFLALIMSSNMVKGAPPPSRGGRPYFLHKTITTVEVSL